jgi:hypothetical protein
MIGRDAKTSQRSAEASPDASPSRRSEIAQQGRSGLETLLKTQAGDRLPPVERWNPPYCGDIGMVIRSDGTWMYQGSPIGRKPLVRLFSRVLRKDDDGRHYLVTPVEKVDVAVADAPFLAVEMTVEGSGAAQTLTFRTNVDDIVISGAANPLRFVKEPEHDGLKPYLLVRGRLEALVTRALYYDLVELAEVRVHEGRETLGVWSDGAYFPMAPADEIAAASEAAASE